MGIGLHYDADAEDNDGKNGGLTATDRVGEPSVQQGADPGTEFENGGGDGLLSTRLGGVTLNLCGLLSDATG